MTRTAVFPGSFDPPTLAHVDLCERGARLFGTLVVGVLNNPEKTPLFNAEERVEMLRKSLSHLDNVQVTSFQGLLVDFVREQGAQAILRGLRAVSDFEYEFQMALMNRRLAQEVETVFLTPREDCTFISSRLVKQIFHFGRIPDNLLPASVEKSLKQKLTGRKTDT